MTAAARAGYSPGNVSEMSTPTKPPSLAPVTLTEIACQTIGVVLTPEERAAAAYLERLGFRFLVNFNKGNCVSLAEQHLYQLDAAPGVH